MIGNDIKELIEQRKEAERKIAENKERYRKEIIDAINEYTDVFGVFRFECCGRSFSIDCEVK